MMSCVFVRMSIQCPENNLVDVTSHKQITSKCNCIEEWIAVLQDIALAKFCQYVSSFQRRGS